MARRPVVLVVEDNTELRNALKDAFVTEGYEVLATKDDVEALEVLREQAVDLLISDLTDPPTSSLALDEVKREFPDLPVIATSDRSGGHPALFYSSWEGPGGHLTLPKPFRLGELLAVSREVLGPV